MRYLALVTDYDDTLAKNGRVMASVAVALERLRTSGRQSFWKRDGESITLLPSANASTVSIR